MRIRTVIGPLFALALAVFVAYLTQHTSDLLGLPFALTDQRAVAVFVVLAAVSAAPWTFGPMVSDGRQGRTNGIKQR